MRTFVYFISEKSFCVWRLSSCLHKKFVIYFSCFSQCYDVETRFGYCGSRIEEGSSFAAGRRRTANGRVVEIRSKRIENGQRISARLAAITCPPEPAVPRFFERRSPRVLHHRKAFASVGQRRSRGGDRKQSDISSSSRILGGNGDVQTPEPSKKKEKGESLKKRRRRTTANATVSKRRSTVWRVRPIICPRTTLSSRRTSRTRLTVSG